MEMWILKNNCNETLIGELQKKVRELDNGIEPIRIEKQQVERIINEPVGNQHAYNVHNGSPERRR
jgi:hypothetical protein